MRGLVRLTGAALRLGSRRFVRPAPSSLQQPAEHEHHPADDEKECCRRHLGGEGAAPHAARASKDRDDENGYGKREKYSADPHQSGRKE